MKVKHFCERGMETNFKNAYVFIKQPCSFCELFVKDLHTG